MKYHRINGEIAGLDSDKPDGANATETESLCLKVLQENPPDATDPLKRNLPLQPRSYRDLMLYERHYYGAVVGMVQLHRPLLSKIAWLYSTLTGWDFPSFKPGPLWYKQPIFYQSNHLAFYADGAPIHYPKYCEYLDVELELGIILGKPLFNATPDEATAAIAGFCVFNDFSARNVQGSEMASGFGPQHAKCFANSISSVVASADEILPRIDKLTGRVVINDKVVAECTSKNSQFTVGESLAHISKSTRMYPGEFVGTGTWPGGTGIEYAKYQVRVGDVVRLEIDGIGSVTNEIVPE